MRVLILGGRAPVALDFARHFAAAGHAVLVTDSVPCRLTGSSRSVVATLPRLPAPRTQLAEFAVALSHCIEQHAIDLVVPTCEEVFYLARVQPRLPAHCQVFAPPFTQLQRLHSKHEALRIAAALGIRVPATACVMNIGEARDWARGRGVVLKPEFSRFGVHVRSWPEGIPHDAPELPALGRWVVQELRTGRELCSYAIATRGRLALNACYEPSWRLPRSSSYYFDARSAPGIDAAVAQFVEATGHHGHLSFDWFMEPDGIATMIECNPRAVSGAHLLPAGGAVPAAIIDGQPCAFDAPRIRPRMLAPLMLTAGLGSALRHGQLARWWRDWRRADDVFARAGDRAPLAGALRDLGSFAAMARRQRCSLREASTRDIEWDGEPLPE